MSGLRESVAGLSNPAMNNCTKFRHIFTLVAHDLGSLIRTIGVRADQLLLKDLILTRLGIPHTQYTSRVLDEITNSLSLNWFLSLFHNCLPWQVSYAARNRNAVCNGHISANKGVHRNCNLLIVI